MPMAQDETTPPVAYVREDNRRSLAMLRLTLISLLALAITAPPANAQLPQGSVRGTVTDQNSRDPLPGVIVLVVGTTLGTSTDQEGRFILQAVPAGLYALEFRLVGYENRLKTDIQVSPGRVTVVSAGLNERIVEAEGVTVTGGYFGTTDPVSSMSVGFNAEEIRRSPGSANDVSRILLALPSTAKVADNANDLAVRGGSPIENGFYVDGISIPNINHFPVQGSTGGPIGLINIDFIDRVDFLMSGFSASYGDRLSSVVDIGFREGSRDAFYAKAFLSFAGFGATGEGPLPGESGSWLLSVNKSYLQFLVKAIGTGAAPNYGDIQGKLDFRLGPNHTLTVLGIAGQSDIDFDRETSIDLGQRQYGWNENSQVTAGLRWTALWNTRYYSNTAFSYSAARYRIDFNRLTTDQTWIRSDNTDRNLVFRSLHFVQLGGRTRLESGIEAKLGLGEYDTFFASDTNRLGEREPERTIQKRIAAPVGALFATLITGPWERWTLSLGARADHFALSGSATLSPRAAISYGASEDLTLHLRGGVFTQQVPGIVVSGDDKFEKLPLLRSTHVGLGADYMLRPDTKLTVELYSKDYENLPQEPADPTLSVVDQGLFNERFRVYTDLVSTGKALTRGVEIIVQKKMAEGLYGLVSGSYSVSRYRDYNGTWHARVFDNRWIFSVVGGYKPDQSWEFSARWTYAGGPPYTPFDEAASQAANIGIIDQNRIMAARYPDYHSLNLRVDKKFYFSSHLLDVYLSVWNAYNRKNVAGYFWNSTENRVDTQYQWSVLPVVGVEYEF